MRLCTWQTTELPCHGNAHNCLVPAMSRRHDEKWKIPKEKKSCLAGHYTLEITSFWKLCSFYHFYKLRTPVNHVRYSPVILLLLLLPPADDICVRDTGNVRTAPPAPDVCAPEPTLGSSPLFQHLGKNATFSYLAALTEDWELKSSQSSSITAAAITDTRGLIWTG